MCLKDVPTEKQPNRKIPHNPCINAGAIMAVSMVHPTLSRAERHERVLEVWRRLSGPNAPIGYDEDTCVDFSVLLRIPSCNVPLFWDY
jgi:glutaminase